MIILTIKIFLFLISLKYWFKPVANVETKFPKFSFHWYNYQNGFTYGIDNRDKDNSY